MISERFIIKKQNIVLLIKILKNLYNIIIDNIYWYYTRKFLFLKNNIVLYTLIVLINIK